MLTPRGDRLVGLARTRARARAAMPVGPVADRPRDVERVRLEDRRVDLAQLLELARCAGSASASTSWCACSGVSSSRLRSEPTPVPTLITIASRIGSIGGLVTCANSCLK